MKLKDLLDTLDDYIWVCLRAANEDMITYSTARTVREICSKDAKLKEATVDYIYLPKMGDCKTALGVRLSNEN